MDVAPFVDQYDSVAPLYGLSPAELRLRDNGEPPQRWVASRDGSPVGVATATHRPDGRIFLRFVGDLPGSCRALSDAAADAVGASLHTFADASDQRAVASLSDAGYRVELTEEAFRLRFDKSLARLRRAWVPARFAIIGADKADEARLFELDNAIRDDVPGTDGWRGDRSWFRDELAESPPFDPSAYLVAVEVQTGEYAGLVRIWRNPLEPRLGLIGVRRGYRSTPLAAALLHRALQAASQWGYDSFVTETSLDNHTIYSRMSRLGAQSLGRFHQMVRPYVTE